jgi:hypothetical protein
MQFYWFINIVSLVAVDYPRQTLNTALPTETFLQNGQSACTVMGFDTEYFGRCTVILPSSGMKKRNPSSRFSGNTSKRECWQVCENNVI